MNRRSPGVRRGPGLRFLNGATRALAAFAALGLFPAAEAADLKIVEVKAYAYLEHAGKLSDALVDGQEIVNAPRGGALGGDTATGLLLDFIFEGDKNASPKDATAIVNLTQTSRSGERLVTHKAFTNFVFGADGGERRAVFLEGATCMPLAIEVRAGHTSKAASLDFQCEGVRGPN